MGIRFYSYYPGRATGLRFKKCLGTVWWVTWRLVVLTSLIILFNKACTETQHNQPINYPD